MLNITQSQLLSPLGVCLIPRFCASCNSTIFKNFVQFEFEINRIKYTIKNILYNFIQLKFQNKLQQCFGLSPDITNLSGIHVFSQITSYRLQAHCLQPLRKKQLRRKRLFLIFLVSDWITIVVNPHFHESTLSYGIIIIISFLIWFSPRRRSLSEFVWSIGPCTMYTTPHRFTRSHVFSLLIMRFI